MPYDAIINPSRSHSVLKAILQQLCDAMTLAAHPVEGSRSISSGGYNVHAPKLKATTMSFWQDILWDKSEKVLFIFYIENMQ